MLDEKHCEIIFKGKIWWVQLWILRRAVLDYYGIIIAPHFMLPALTH